MADRPRVRSVSGRVVGSAELGGMSRARQVREPDECGQPDHGVRYHTTASIASAMPSDVRAAPWGVIIRVAERNRASWRVSLTPRQDAGDGAARGTGDERALELATPQRGVNAWAADTELAGGLCDRDRLRTPRANLELFQPKSAPSLVRSWHARRGDHAVGRRDLRKRGEAVRMTVLARAAARASSCCSRRSGASRSRFGTRRHLMRPCFHQERVVVPNEGGAVARLPRHG
jgi:hypothetical protein